MKNQLRKMSSKERPSPVLAGEPDCLWALLNWELARFSWDTGPCSLWGCSWHSPTAPELWRWGGGRLTPSPGLICLRMGLTQLLSVVWGNQGTAISASLLHPGCARSPGYGMLWAVNCNGSAGLSTGIAVGGRVTPCCIWRFYEGHSCVIILGCNCLCSVSL